MVTKEKGHRKCTCRFLWSNELHALNQFFVAKTWKARLFWGSLISFFILLASFTTYNTIQIYRERQSTTLIVKNRVKELQFPSVVVCPKNPDALNIKAIIREIRRKVPHISILETGNLISFAIAGSGFGNMEPIVLKLASLHLQRLSFQFKRWKGNRTYNEFYNDLYVKYGYKCEDLFHTCVIGAKAVDCCKRFQPQYVILRGKCFRLKDHYQVDPNLSGKLMLYVKQLPSPLVEPSGLQLQTVVHLSDNYSQIATFPRFYINSGEKINVRMWLTELRMLPINNDCSTDPKHQGIATCYVNKYHKTRIILPLNCSLFFLSYQYPGYKICDPLEIVYNYNTVGNMEISSFGERCTPACTRQMIRFKLFKTGTIAKVKSQNLFVFQASYLDLEYDTYNEIIMTTLPGFISELGGQSGLFLGFSLISVFNVFVSLITYFYKRIIGRNK